MCPALKTWDLGATQTSEQAIIPQASGAEVGRGQSPRRHIVGEESNPICQGLEGSQKQWRLTAEQKAADNTCLPPLWVWGCTHLGVCLGVEERQGENVCVPQPGSTRPLVTKYRTLGTSRQGAWIPVSTLRRRLTHFPSILTV